MTKPNTANNSLKYEALTISITIMALAVLLIGWVAIISKNALYLVYALPYSVAIGCSYAVLKNKIKSEVLRRIIILLDIIGVGSVLYFLWIYITFVNTF
ncbi:MAG: hypothetical protein HZB75_03365 [Candidatus Saccharibacteria bacterium]|nr:MAG: hypothetical protein HZB75_03365 [Candidatus Saccharibacteria bacterium]